MKRTLEAAFFFALLMVVVGQRFCRARIWSLCCCSRPTSVAPLPMGGRTRGWPARVGDSRHAARLVAATYLGSLIGTPLGSSPPA